MKKLIIFMTLLFMLVTSHTASASPSFTEFHNFYEEKVEFEYYAKQWGMSSQATKDCLESNKKYVVNVAATTLWLEPNKARAMDQPSLSNPVNLAAWTKSMSIAQKLWLVGKIETQALYGEEVMILQSQGEWYQIAVKNQSTPKNKTGYPGWVPKSHISEYKSDYQTCKFAVVDAMTTALYNDAALKSPFMQISFNTRLPIIEESQTWIKVQTPSNSVKYMKKEDAAIFANELAIHKPTQNELVQTSKKFIGLPYLWAGTTGFGFDCSGFTYSIYKRYGILIPRDASAQFKEGTVISKKNMQAGDLMFFAYNHGKGRIHHVSMYIGNNQMIHSPNSSSSIEIVSINAEPYKSEFAGARRYIK